jgi:hypothetical protein
MAELDRVLILVILVVKLILVLGSVNWPGGNSDIVYFNVTQIVVGCYRLPFFGRREIDLNLKGSIIVSLFAILGKIWEIGMREIELLLPEQGCRT